MTYDILEEAEAEFWEAEARYTPSGYGEAFVDAVRGAIRDILAYPEAWPKVGEQARHRILNRFPYSVVYVVRGEHITIVAIAHGSRQFGYWQDRLD